MIKEKYDIDIEDYSDDDFQDSPEFYIGAFEAGLDTTGARKKRGLWWWVWNTLKVLSTLAIVIPYILLPIFFRFTLTLDPETTLVSLGPDNQKLPFAVKAYFNLTREELEDLGFYLVDYMTDINEDNRFKNYIMYMENRTKKIVCMAVGSHSDRLKSKTMERNYLEFLSTFKNGIDITTNNHIITLIFADEQQESAISFPKIEDPEKLYEIHEFHCEKLNSGKSRILEFPGQPVAFMNNSQKLVTEGQVKAGYFFYSLEKEKFYPTIKGAYFMTWKLLPPWNLIVRKQMDKEAVGILSDLYK